MLLLLKGPALRSLSIKTILGSWMVSSDPLHAYSPSVSTPTFPQISNEYLMVLEGVCCDPCYSSCMDACCDSYFDSCCNSSFRFLCDLCWKFCRGLCWKFCRGLCCESCCGLCLDEDSLLFDTVFTNQRNVFLLNLQAQHVSHCSCSQCQLELHH